MEHLAEELRVRALGVGVLAAASLTGVRWITPTKVRLQPHLDDVPVKSDHPACGPFPLSVDTLDTGP